MISTNKAAKGDARDCRGEGRFYFFWNLLRADALGSWDLVVSAPWLEERRLKPLGEFTELLTKSIGRQSLRQFARIVTLNPRDPALKAVVSAYSVDDGEVRVQHSKLFGLDIED